MIFLKKKRIIKKNSQCQFWELNFQTMKTKNIRLRNDLQTSTVKKSLNSLPSITATKNIITQDVYNVIKIILFSSNNYEG